MEALRATVTGDASADSDMWLAVKTGTLAGRSSVTHKVGRFYRTTDTHELFVSDGTNWRHCGGAGAFDDFFRGNNTNLNTNNPYQPSGSPWTEEAGDWDILSNQLRLTAATTAYATLNTSSLLSRPYEVNCTLQTHGTQSSIDSGIVLKFVDTSNVLYFQLLPTAFQIHGRIAGATTLIASIAFTPAASTVYEVRGQVFGSTVKAWVNSATTFGVFVAGRHANVNHANLAAATKVGFRTVNTGERYSGIEVSFK